MRIEAWAWLIVPLGACRAMQLILHDRILDKPRNWILRKVNPEDRQVGDPQMPYIAYLLECPWCTSMWIGLGVMAALIFEEARRPALWVLLALAVSLVAVVIDRLIDVYASDEAAAERAAKAHAEVHVHTPPAPPPAAVSAAFEQLEPGVADRPPAG